MVRSTPLLRQKQVTSSRLDAVLVAPNFTKQKSNRLAMKVGGFLGMARVAALKA